MFTLCLSLLLTSALSKYTGVTESFQVSVGDTLLNITRETFPVPEKCLSCTSLAFLNLHENENTSVVAARSLLLSSGGSLVKFDKGNSRLVSFYMDGIMYSVDPNRIFTPEGIEASLKQYGPYSTDAANEVAELAEFVLDIYDFDNQNTVLALHNNGGQYGADSYLPGGPYDQDASAVYIEEGSNPSDFFYVVDPDVYATLSSEGYNIVLQNNETVTNDGSLSYYSGIKGKAYINFESQAEYTSFGYQVVIQLDMIQAVYNMLRK
mmetsp:Transcript_14392/g.21574  ORF Transcript_14392/g.21574 Transcript_14392/m.21574 type:complete len:265 (+) Transcript_14392:54-848(+)